jgi:ATP-dependent Clp protease protease subunit
MTGGWPPEVPPPGVPGVPDPPAPAPRPPYPPVPVVYEESPGGAQLVDRLLERRMVLVSGHLDLAAATDAAARLMLLDGSGDEAIELMLTCPDGDLGAAMALADTVELVGVTVRALCAGSIGGPALLPFAVATRRIAQPHATFLLAEPRLEVDGRASDVAAEAARHAELVVEFQRRLAEATGQPVDVIAADLRRRRFLTATDAMACGLVDEIASRGRLRSL